ncbi:MAG: sigma-54-dependent Fis family transcriptional regulator [Myxococcaceae bacterium]|nr:sigma-54-dependent Fis family transcriptional regulator [Myxococcaceae bacterium]
MRQVLVTWVGRTDLRAPTEPDEVGVGPIAQALDARKFDEAFLVTDYPEAKVKPFVQWLKGRSQTKLVVLPEPLSGPTNLGEIFQAAVRACTRALGSAPAETALSFHLSPGTPAMAAVWILLSKTRFNAELIESSREHGVKTTPVPFEISMDFIPELLRERDEKLRSQSAGAPPDAPEFADIIHRSRSMQRVIQMARKVAVRNVPVVIEGESGTGKEMLARAIHRASPRQAGPFIAVNCGAISPELVESELFGHEKGAFTDAKQARSGYFEAASGGTLFLDELGELPLTTQVKLLRVVQEGEVVRVGSQKPLKVNVRIVAATNRTLTEEIAAGRFREDLFFRLAVAVLKLPPLRDRKEDVGLLVDRLMEQVNHEATGEPGFKHKKLSAGAKNVLLNHPWPGNVRELLNTLRRATIWSDESTMSTEDVRESLLPAAGARQSEVLGRPLGGTFKLEDLLDDVARHYLRRAMVEAGWVKKKAAELVGLPSYQTLSNWLTRYKVNG